MRNILIADDSATGRFRLERLLTSAGYTVTTANDGAQAVEIARRTRPDAILLDIIMPGMDGFAATRALKADEATRAIPVMLVSVKHQHVDQAWGQKMGAKSHIGKPYTDEEMLRQVVAL